MRIRSLTWEHKILERSSYGNYMTTIMAVSPAKNRKCRATVPKYMNIAEALFTVARQRESIAKRFSRFTKKLKMGQLYIL